MFIYLIVNRATGKYYVGQHKGSNLKKYLQQKLSQAWYELKRKGHGRGSYLYNSMRKHSKEAWSIHALLSDVQTRSELDQHEKNFIAFLRSQNPEYGYNICRGGEGFTGPHSEESRRKCRQNSARYWKGKKRSRDTVSKIMETRRKNGIVWPPKGSNQDPRLIAKRVATRRAKGNYGTIYVPSHKGRHHTSKTKEGMRQKRLAYLATLATGIRSDARPAGTAWCSGHKQFLPIKNFDRSGKRPLGVRSYCKACRHKEYLNSQAKKGTFQPPFS